MIYNYKEIKTLYKDNYNIKKAIADNKIFKLEKGIYSTKRNVDPIVIYSKKYPNSVVTMDSAFFYYKLTDVIPQKVYLATDRNSDTIKNENIVQYFTPKDILLIGKTKVIVDGEEVNMYDKERLLIELIRKSKQISFDYYKEIIANYRKIADDLDMRKIEQYLSFFKNEYNLGNALLREVF